MITCQLHYHLPTRPFIRRPRQPEWILLVADCGTGRPMCRRWLVTNRFVDYMGQRFATDETSDVSGDNPEPTSVGCQRV